MSVATFPFATVEDAVDVAVEFAARPGTPAHEELMWRNLARTLAWQRRQVRRMLADPDHLNRFERRVYSQAGEDGVLGEILRRAGATNRYFVEVGSGDGSENCTRALLEEGWHGCWMEADARYAASAEAIGGGRVAVRHAMVDRENAVALLDATGVPPEPDVISIDVDGNDHWLWQAIAHTRRPRVVVIEYNARFPPPVRWALPYRADRMWDGSYRQGATLSALDAIGAGLGYRLVGCCSFGANAFFVREDVARASGSLAAVAPAEAYWPAAWNPGHFGHVALMEHRIGTLTVPQADQVLVTDGALHSDLPLRVGQPVAYSLRIENRSRAPIGGGGVAGAFAVCEWVPAGASGPRSWFRWGGPIQGLIRPGERRLLMGGWRAPDEPGEYVARVGLGQEPDGPAANGSACCEVPVSVGNWPS